MKTLQKLKEIVRQKYSKIAEQDKILNKVSCFSSGAASTEVHTIMTDDNSLLEGYQTDADAGPDCGLPTQFAQMSRGRGMPVPRVRGVVESRTSSLKITGFKY